MTMLWLVYFHRRILLRSVIGCALAILAAVSGGCGSCHKKVAMKNYISPSTSFDIPIEERVALEEKAENGDGASAYRLYLFHGFYMNDDAVGLRWLRQSAEMKYPNAEYSLGVLMLYRTDIKDESAGWIWIKRAASSGYAPAIEALNRNRK